MTPTDLASIYAATRTAHVHAARAVTALDALETPPKALCAALRAARDAALTACGEAWDALLEAPGGEDLGGAVSARLDAAERGAL